MAYATTAEFIDKEILSAHNTRLTGEMFVNNWRWYKIPVLNFLVIAGAETSLGDLKQGGLLAEKNNFGCLRYFTSSANSKWGSLSDGTVVIRGVPWYTFPTPQIGMMAFGRYLKIGPKNTEFYFKVLNEDPVDWRVFANTYYGEGVPGLENYIQDLKNLNNKFRSLAINAGFVW